MYFKEVKQMFELSTLEREQYQNKFKKYFLPLIGQEIHTNCTIRVGMNSYHVDDFLYITKFSFVSKSGNFISLKIPYNFLCIVDENGVITDVK